MYSHQSFLKSAAFLLFSAKWATAALNKPVIVPAMPGLDQGLLDHLNPTQSHWDQWGAGWIPQDCKTFALTEGKNPADFEVFNIFYTDCPNDSWVFCRHHDSPLSQVQIIDLFGRMPVNMRDVVRHIVAIPGPRSAYSTGDNILISGDCPITVFVHETAHSLDGHAYPGISPAAFHDSSIWLDNYNQDSAVSDPYAQTNQAENHSQEVVIALFDKVVPGGIGTVQPNWQAIFHQYATIQGFIGNGVLIPGGTCNNRLVNSAPVPMSGSKRSPLGAAPSTKLSSDVKELPFRPMQSQVTKTFYDEHGNAIKYETVNLAINSKRFMRL